MSKRNLAKNGDFLIFKLRKKLELKAKRPRAEPSQAENTSARAMAQASLAKTHDYNVHTEIKYLSNISFQASKLLQLSPTKQFDNTFTSNIKKFQGFERNLRSQLKV